MNESYIVSYWIKNLANLSFKKIITNLLVKNKFYKKPLSIRMLTLIFSSSILVMFSDWLINDLDRGSNEFFQQHLLFWCGILSIYWVLRNKSFLAISIPGIYFFLSLDDYYYYHDRFANNLFPDLYERFFSFPIQSIAPIERIGELIYWLFIFLFFIFISFPGIKSGIKPIENFIMMNFAILFALSWFFSGTLIFIEEIGSTITLAFACIKLFDMNIKNPIKLLR